jgi:cellulose synthase/poly-beta-1,6-N-acetylglucosamine synthase-like glycosyltransferase
VRPLLTIAIPTYNRAPALARTLAVITPQLSRDVECLVLNNASTDDTAVVAARAAEQCSFVRVIEHAVNVGGNGNFLRCFEHGTGEWLWILPDDDEPFDDAVPRIVGVIGENPDAIYINFATSLLAALGSARNHTTRSHGLHELAVNLDSFSNLVFLTAGVYRRQAVIESLPYGSRMAYSYAPYLAMLFSSLTNNPRALTVQSSVQIANWVGGRQWNVAEGTLGMYHLLEPCRALETRQVMARRMTAEIPPYLDRRTWVSDLVAAAADPDPEVFVRARRRYALLAILARQYRLAAAAAATIDGLTPVGSKRMLRMAAAAREWLRRGSRSVPRRLEAGDAAEVRRM